MRVCSAHNYRVEKMSSEIGEKQNIVRQVGQSDHFVSAAMCSIAVVLVDAKGGMEHRVKCPVDRESDWCCRFCGIQ